MGREETEAKRLKKLEELKKKHAAKNKGKAKNKPLKMDRESVEKRRMEKLEEIRLKRKAAKLQKSIDKENKILNQTKKRSELDKLEKKQLLSNRKKQGDGITEMGLHPRTGKVIDKQQADILIEVKKILDLNKGSTTSKKGYRGGGMATCGASNPPSKKR